MKKYEVTIPFKKMPWYTGYALAGDKQSAIAIVSADAKRQGFNGVAARAQVLEVQ